MFAKLRNNVLVAALSLAGIAAAANPAAAANVPQDNLPTSTRVMAQYYPRYVWAYTQFDLQNAIAISRSQGFRTVGYPQFRYVPEAGGMAWMIYITPCLP